MYLQNGIYICTKHAISPAHWSRLATTYWVASCAKDVRCGSSVRYTPNSRNPNTRKTSMRICAWGTYGIVL